MIGGNNYWPSSYSPNTKLLYIPALTGCVNVEIDRAKHNAEKGWNGGNATSNERFESNLTAVDPITQEIKKNAHLSYPNFSGALATGGGLVFLGLFDGTVAENICRFDVGATSDAILKAAQIAGVHDTILRLPDG